MQINNPIIQENNADRKSLCGMKCGESYSGMVSIIIVFIEELNLLVQVRINSCKLPFGICLLLHDNIE